MLSGCVAKWATEPRNTRKDTKEDGRRPVFFRVFSCVSWCYSFFSSIASLTGCTKWVLRFSPIKRAEYSLDAGDWQFVEPVGQLSDSKTEDYDFRVPLTAAVQAGSTPVSNDHVVVVRAYDRFDNLATAKVVIRPK